MEEAKREYVNVWASHVVMGVAGTIAVILRFIARRRTKSTLKWDDWFVLIALVSMWGDFACTILEYRPYYKRVPSKQLPIPEQSTQMLLSFVSVFFTGGTEVFARLSVILLYYRLFSIKVWLGWCLKIIAAITVIWLLVLVFAITFNCKPVAAVVDASVKGTCTDTQFGFLITELINLVLDFSLAVLPIRTIWKLHLPLNERLGISGIFLTGTLVVVTQILRLIFGYNPTSADRSITSLAHLSVWTGLHLGFSIICACLPVFRVYMPKDNGVIQQKLRFVYYSVSNWVGRSTRSRSSSQTTAGGYLPSFVKRSLSPEDDTRKPKGPLTNQSVVSEVEMVGRSEYHLHSDK